MRLHEALLCVAAVMLPFAAFLAGLEITGLPLWWAAPATLPVSLAIVWLVGWMIDHTYA